MNKYNIDNQAVTYHFNFIFNGNEHNTTMINLKNISLLGLLLVILTCEQQQNAVKNDICSYFSADYGYELQIM